MIRAASIILALALLAGCSSFDPHPELPDVPKEISYWDNSCLPAAISMGKGLDGYDIPNQVLILRFADGSGHAVCAYKYKGKTWIYDTSLGSVPGSNYFLWDQLAANWTARWYPQLTLKSVQWL
jgi:hypothetical protein